jgi:hypothetical protein
MSWVQNQLDDEKLFPQKIGESVPFISKPRRRTTFLRPTRSHDNMSVADTLNCSLRCILTRRPFPEKLPLDVQDDPEEVVPGVRSYLLRTLRSDLRFGDRR